MTERREEVDYCESLQVSDLKNMCSFNGVTGFSRWNKNQLVEPCCKVPLRNISENDFVRSIAMKEQNRRFQRRLNIGKLLGDFSLSYREEIYPYLREEKYDLLKQSLDHFWFGPGNIPKELHCAVEPSKRASSWEVRPDAPHTRRGWYVKRNNLICWTTKEGFDESSFGFVATVPGQPRRDLTEKEKQFFKFKQINKYGSQIVDLAYAREGKDALVQSNGSAAHIDNGIDAATVAKALRTSGEENNTELQEIKSMLRDYAEERGMSYFLTCEAPVTRIEPNGSFITSVYISDEPNFTIEESQDDRLNQCRSILHKGGSSVKRTFYTMFN